MSGVQGLKKIRRFSPAHLAHHDVIRPMAQGMAHQIPDRHRPALQPPRLEAHAVGPLDA